jgi:predicted acylesterase/phospholipase RssA
MATSVIVAVLLVAGAAVALALLGVYPWIALAGVAIVAVGAALIGAQVAVVGSWLTRRTPPPDAPDEETSGSAR